MSNKNPDWLKKRVRLNNSKVNEIKSLIDNLQLNTVCQSAQCPNIYECFSKKTATFMLMGDICTRNCGFCGIKTGKPEALDEDEPLKIARAVKKLGLKYVVITSVTRDDLPDGGSNHFAQTIREIKRINQDIEIECLIPDFKGNIKNLETVLRQELRVLNHNIETTKKNYKEFRNKSNYEHSLKILKYAKLLRPDIFTKSGFMLGPGEDEREIIGLLSDLKKVDCDIVTIGQYLRPSSLNIPVKKLYSPAEFKKIGKLAESYGFKAVVSGVFVRSSYNAAAVLDEVFNIRKNAVKNKDK